MRHAVHARGGCPIEFPLLRIGPVVGEARAALVAALRRFGAGDYAGLIITSQNAVAHLQSLLNEAWPQTGPMVSTSASAPVFAVGQKTADALAALGLEALTPERSTGEALLALAAATVRPLRGARFLFPRAKDGRLAIIAGLRDAGAEVDALTLYTTHKLLDGPCLPPTIRIDWVTFMSPSAVEAFVERTDLMEWTRVACIGPTTAERAHELGLPVDVVSETQSFEAMLEAMVVRGS
jgi:uroporphyrinogen-III synthase